MAHTRGESKLAQYKSHWRKIHQKQDRQQGLICTLSADNTNSAIPLRPCLGRASSTQKRQGCRPVLGDTGRQAVSD